MDPIEKCSYCRRNAAHYLTNRPCCQLRHAAQLPPDALRPHLIAYEAEHGPALLVEYQTELQLEHERLQQLQRRRRTDRGR